MAQGKKPIQGPPSPYKPTRNVEAQKRINGQLGRLAARNADTRRAKSLGRGPKAV